MELSEATPIKDTSELKIDVNHLREFGSKFLNRSDNEKDPDKEYVKKFPEQFTGKLENGMSFQIQLTGPEIKVKKTFNGEEKDILARVWVSDKNGEKSNAHCYTLLKGSDGAETWVLENSRKEPRYDKSLISNFWDLEEPVKAGTVDMAALEGFMENRKKVATAKKNTQ